MRTRANASSVRQSTGARHPWPGLLLLLFPLAVFTVPAAPAYTVAEFVTCEKAKMEAPHDWHVPQAVFGTADDRFFAWVELKQVSGTHPVEMELYRPDGTYYGKETQAINETNRVASWWRMAAWWRIKGDDVAESPGRWKLDLVIDGVLQRSILFDIISGNSVRALDGQLGVAKSGVSAQTIPNWASASQDAKVCVLQASSDLVHGTTILTNALPTGLPWDQITAKGGFRLTLGRLDAGSYLIEVSTDLLNWTPIQTNALPRPSRWEASDAGLVTARFYRPAIQ